MEIDSKHYSTIFWDWFFTLYDESTGSLYDWVMPTFQKMRSEKHYLVTLSSDPERRIELVKSLGMKDFFVEILPVEGNKEAAFKDLIEKYQINRGEILVVGDSYESEIAAAKNLNLDWMHVDDFVAKVVRKEE